MTKPRGRSKDDKPRRLPRGRHALSPEEVREDQRRRLIEAVPRVAAEHGYQTMSVADLVKAAAVSRNAFYDNFASKEECFAAAHEGCHERLLAILEARCGTGSSAEERVETALGAALAMLAAEPDVGRLLFVEAPGASRDLALRYHEWLGRYAALLGAAVPSAGGRSTLAAEIDQIVVGGITSRISGEVLQGRAPQLRLLTPHLVDYVLAYNGAQPGGMVDGGARASEYPSVAARRRRAG